LRGQPQFSCVPYTLHLAGLWDGASGPSRALIEGDPAIAQGLFAALTGLTGRSFLR